MRASSGANIWIIGNEPNHPIEWSGADWDWGTSPPRPRSPEKEGEKITPQRYANCYKRVRAAIKAVPGHEKDDVLAAAVAPWNNLTAYPGNESGDWIRYFQDMLKLIGPDQCDGITLHTYSHGPEVDKIWSDAKMAPPFQAYHFHFHAYQDFMRAIPANMRHLPVYITETDQEQEWRNENTGWVRHAYGDIDNWNRNNLQKIRCLLLYRWPRLDKWFIEGKQGVIEDFQQAMDFKYQWNVGPVTAPLPDYRAIITLSQPFKEGKAGGEVMVRVQVRNTGALTWPHTGSNPVRLGYRWKDEKGKVVSDDADLRTPLPKAIATDNETTLQTKIIFPDVGGTYTLTLDLIHEGVGWFADKGSKPIKLTVKVSEPAPQQAFFPETRVWVRGPFLAFFRRYGVKVCGYPLTEARRQNEKMIQVFQRMVLEEYEPGKVRPQATGQQAYAAQRQLSELEGRIARLSSELAELEKVKSKPAPQPVVKDIIRRLPRDADMLFKRDDGDIKYIVIHHTGAPESVQVERVAQAHLAQFPAFIGQFFIDADGAILQTNPVNVVVDNKQEWIFAGVNIYVAGNFNDAIPSDAQLNSLAALTAWLLDAYKLPVDAVKGISEFSKTQSPGKQWLQGQRWKHILLGRLRMARAGLAVAGEGGTVDEALLTTLREQTTQLEKDKQRLQVEVDQLNNTVKDLRRVLASSPSKPGTPTGTPPTIIDLTAALPHHPTDVYKSRTLAQITHIAVHHSAAPAHIPAERIAAYHVQSESHLWPGIGYHYYIGPDGDIYQTQDLKLIVYHVHKHNDYTIGVCVAGNFADVIPTPAQINAAARLIIWLMQELHIPLANVKGHQEFPDNSTPCPGRQWLEDKKWRELLFAEIQEAQGDVAAPVARSMSHYVLFWRHDNDWARQDWEGAANYIAHFHPTVGFSVADAMNAERVTIVGGVAGVSQQDEDRLRAAGIQVERINGRDFAETKAILDQLAQSDQRFLNP